MTGWRRYLVCLAVGPLLACTSPAAIRQPPPLDASHNASWAYAAYLLSRGEAAAARGYLEVLAAGPLDDIFNRSLLFRDLAEARLFSGDLVGAAAAAGDARRWLAREPRAAQFQADDRLLFERVVDGLEAAAQDDPARLSALATDADTGALPSADVWYLLGWLSERRGDLSAAQGAYRAYLARAPQWAFLREGFVMRRHAQDFLR